MQTSVGKQFDGLLFGTGSILAQIIIIHVTLKLGGMIVLIVCVLNSIRLNGYSISST